MNSLANRSRTFWRALAGSLALFVAIAAAAAAIEAEGELFERDRLVGNFGVSSADIGLYPDRSEFNPAPERTGGSTTITVPDGATIVDTLVYWAGRGAPGWDDSNIVVNGVSVDSQEDYSWTWPGFEQTTYVADLDDVGLSLSSGTNELVVSGADQQGGRFYGVGFVVIYEDSSLPEVELQLIEGNEFAFFNDTFSDAVGQAAVHTSVNCTSFPAAIEDRSLSSVVRIMGVNAGETGAPERSQRIQWWTTTDVVATPITDGLVGIPSPTPDGSIDNPVTPKVAPTGEWGSESVETTASLAAGQTHHCNQVQSVSIGDGAGASLAQTNQTAAAETVHRLGNLVWLDLDEDGLAEIGEPGIDGVTVNLWREGADAPLASTVTGDDGAYAFEGLLCGNYQVSIPGGQAAWTIAGEATNPADLVVDMISNPDADDDADNDNNGIEQADGSILSGVVQIGDCGEDGDFSDDASNEPTNEVDRVGGPDDDPDEVAAADGNFDDVRSNVSVDIGLKPLVPLPASEAIVCDADGNVVEGGVDGVDGATAEACDTPGPEVCDAEGNVVEGGVDGVDGATAEACDDDGPPGVAVGGAVECPAGSDRAGDVVDAVEACDDPEPDPNTDGSAISVEVQGEVETADAGDALAVTGVSSWAVVYGGLMVVVLGLWFAVAAAWFRPESIEI